MPQPEVLCLGLIVADLVCAPIRAFPPSGGLVTTDRLELAIGGCASNVAVDLAKLNVPVGVVGRIGADALGSFVRQSLTDAGVSGEFLSVSDSAQTAATQVVNVAGEDRRFIHAVGANAELTGLELPEAALNSTRILYVGGFGLNAALSGANVRDLFRRARACNVLTVLDVVVGEPQLVRDMLSDALTETDFFLPNRDEAKIITGLDDPWEQAAAFQRQGARTVMITCGGDGVYSLQPNGERMRSGSHAVQQVDGTGGGDAFVAGYLYGLLQQMSPTDCIRHGAALGASCVQAAGATTGVFTESQLREFVEEHPLAVNVVT